MGQSGMGQSGAATLARGGSVLAASLLFLLGVYHFFTGIAAFVRGGFYNVGANYPYQTGNDAWGWLHVIGGVLLAITGLALFGRATWARWVGITLAVVSAVLNFFFLPYFPLWALVMIPLAIFAIWALARDGREQQREEMMAQRTSAGAFGGTARPQTGQQQPQPTERREPAGAAYTSSGMAQTGQRWPENVGGREGQPAQPAQPGQPGERRWSPSDVKEGASRVGEKMQERAQAGARAAGGEQHQHQPQQQQQQQQQQPARSAAEEAAERARQSANRDYRSGR